MRPPAPASAPTPARVGPTSALGRRIARWGIPTLLLALPVAGWFLFKPMRVLAPGWLGMRCAGRVCVEDPSRLALAQATYDEALHFVDERVGRIEAPPRMIFCSTLRCSQRFGFTSDGAYTVGRIGIAISHRGWAPYFARHELIHHLQNERLGVLGAWFGRPQWWREGMANSLSLDTRRPLPMPLEGFRQRFDQWLTDIGGPARIWSAPAD